MQPNAQKEAAVALLRIVVRNAIAIGNPT